ncbi:hypothetical protein ES703_22459 [subsurface metagenome]
MALNEAECNQCQVELDKLKNLPGELRLLPEAQARMGKLKAALDHECSGSNAGAGTAVVVVGLGVLGFGILAALLGSIQIETEDKV